MKPFPLDEKLREIERLMVFTCEMFGCSRAEIERYYQRKNILKDERTFLLNKLKIVGSVFSMSELARFSVGLVVEPMDGDGGV